MVRDCRIAGSVNTSTVFVLRILSNIVRVPDRAISSQHQVQTVDSMMDGKGRCSNVTAAGSGSHLDVDLDADLDAPDSTLR